MIAMDLKYINKEKLELLKTAILKILNQLNGLKKTITKVIIVDVFNR